MLTLLPRPADLPPLSLLLADLGRPSPRDLARALGVELDQAARWIADDAAPRAAMLAVWSVTRWGRDAAACQAEQAAQTARGMIDCQARELAELRAELAELRRLVELADQAGAANAPRWSGFAVASPVYLPGFPPVERQAGQEAGRRGDQYLPRQAVELHA